MTIILDLDHTLLNTERLKHKMLELVKPFGVTEEVFKKSYDETRLEGEYKPKTQAEKIAQILKKPELATKINEKLYQAADSAGDLLYEDAKEFLSKVKKVASLILLTRANPKWQERKISACGIKGYFNEIIISPADKNKILEEMKIDNLSFLITDNAKEIPNIKNPKVKIIQLIRLDGRYRTEAQGVPIVNDLNEALKIITAKNPI